MDQIKMVQKHLQNQSKDKRFRKVIKKSILRALICGEQVLKPSILDKVIWKSVSGRIMLNNDGSPAMTSNDKFILDTDSWSPLEDGINEFLNKDPNMKRKIELGRRDLPRRRGRVRGRHWPR